MEHKLKLPNRRRSAMAELLKGMEISDVVFYKDEQRSVVSIYPESSPLFGYILLTGIGSPVLVSSIKKSKKQ